MLPTKAAGWILLSLFLIHFGSSPAVAQKEAAAEEAARAWLTLIDERAYAASWEEAGELMQTALTKDGWRSAVQNARNQLNALLPGLDFTKRKLIAAQYTENVPNAPKGAYVITQYSITHGGAEVIETVSLHHENEAWKVVGYFIKPK